MRYESGQFGSFDGKDNRRSIMEMLARLGHGLPEQQQAQMRAQWLSDLVMQSETCFAQKVLLVHLDEPCCLVDAYFAFTAITGVLGVPVEKAAKLLEERIRFGDRRAPHFRP